MALTTSSPAAENLRSRWSRSRQPRLRLVADRESIDAPADVEAAADLASSTEVEIRDEAFHETNTAESRLEAAELRAATAVAATLRSKLQIMQLHRDCDTAQTDALGFREALEHCRSKLEAHVQLLGEFDGLWQRTRIERDHARVEVLRLTSELARERAAQAQLLQALDDVAIRSTEQVREIARIAQNEVDQAFETGAALGQRAAERVVVLEQELERLRAASASAVVIVDYQSMQSAPI